MPYQPVKISAFGGLNYKDDEKDFGFANASQLNNVDLSRKAGGITPRPGYVNVTSTTYTDVLGPMAHYRVGANEFIVARTTTSGVTTPLSIDGGSNGPTVATAAFSNNGMVQYGTATLSKLFMVDGGNTMRSFDGTSWASTTLPSGFNAFCVAVMPNSNRLIVAGSDTVFFSDPDAPTTFQYNSGTDEGNYVRLSPGDGENITAVVGWREYVFVFKQSKFYVFLGESVDTTGGPIFNYRTVSTGRGATSNGCAAAGEEGVFFADAGGLYVTTGDAPVYLSRNLEAPYSQLSWTSPTAVVYWRRRLYVLTHFVGQTGVILVYDPSTEQFVSWSGLFTSLCAPPGNRSLYLGDFAKRLGVMTGLATSDAGDEIDWSYVTGFSDLGTPDRKVVREMSVWSDMALKPMYRTNSEISNPPAVTSPVNGEIVLRVAKRGTYFKVVLEGVGTTGGTISGVVLRLRDMEDPK